MWRLISVVLMFLGMAALAADEVAAPADTEASSDTESEAWSPLCIDAVVVARITDYRLQPIPDLGPDVIVSRSATDLDLDVTQVYLGDVKRGRLTIVGSLHGGFRDGFPMLLMLTRQKDDSWYMVEGVYALRDDSGQYVVPMYGEAEDWQLSPKGWMPHDYQRWLQPIRYTTRARYPGLSGQYGDENEWVRISGGRPIMKRGFQIARLPEMLAERRALECRHPGD